MNIAAPQWVIDLRPYSGRARTTTCSMTIYIDDVAVWPVPGEEEARLEIQIDDLLAHLTEFWKPLMLRQVYPIDVSPLRPSDLRREAERRWAEWPSAISEIEDDAVSRFEEAQDFSRAFAGIYGLPPFWILRSGEQFILETSGTIWHFPFADVRSVLAATGDWICKRLAQSDEERWERAIAAWRERDAGDAVGLLAWSAGLDRALATTLIQEGALDAPRDFEDAANDNDELRIAARMVGALPAAQIREIIALARQFPAREAERLHRLSEACLKYVAGGFGQVAPFHRGEAAARFVRQQLEIPDDGPVQIFEIVASLGVDLRHAAAEPPTLTGLAIWGSRHGPGIFLNESSTRILGVRDRSVYESLGARVTLAHELCHLLLDGGHALSAVEVLKARMPVGVEQRAKSFAGEFLLPTQIAGRHWQDAGRPNNRIELDTLVQDLVDRYLITRSVAAWKVEHAARGYNVELGAALDAVAPRR